MFNKTLFGLSKNGKYKVWNIQITEGELPRILIEYGEENGTMTSDSEVVKEGKQGRTAYEQAVLQAEARIKKKVDANYRETKIELNSLPILAMLSKDHTKDGKEETINKGVFTSDKLDGVRCIAKCLMGPTTGEKYVKLFTRTGQDWHVPHISKQLMEVMDVGDIFDGELYVHGPALQEITSAVKRGDAEEKAVKAKIKYDKACKTGDLVKTAKAYSDMVDAFNIADIRKRLEYHIFDIVDFDKPFEERLDSLDFVSEAIYDNRELTGNLKVLHYRYAKCIETLNEYLKDCIDRGFEGIMYRTKDGMYENGKRSTGLWKYKLFFDEEFLILNVVEDKNGHGVFVCKNNVNDETFQCVMGSHQEREGYLGNAAWIIGNALTVKYQSRYKGTLLPQFPTGVVLREGDWNGDVFTPTE